MSQVQKVDFQRTIWNYAKIRSRILYEMILLWYKYQMNTCYQLLTLFPQNVMKLIQFIIFN